MMMYAVDPGYLLRRPAAKVLVGAYPRFWKTLHVVTAADLLGTGAGIAAAVLPGKLADLSTCTCTAFRQAIG